jgi:hypothetical protein
MKSSQAVDFHDSPVIFMSSLQDVEVWTCRRRESSINHISSKHLKP